MPIGVDEEGFNMDSGQPGTSQTIRNKGYIRLTTILRDLYNGESLSVRQEAEMRVYACERFDIRISYKPNDYWLAMTETIIDVLTNFPLRGHSGDR